MSLREGPEHAKHIPFPFSLLELVCRQHTCILDCFSRWRFQEGPALSKLCQLSWGNQQQEAHCDCASSLIFHLKFTKDKADFFFFYRHDFHICFSTASKIELRGVLFTSSFNQILTLGIQKWKRYSLRSWSSFCLVPWWRNSLRSCGLGQRAWVLESHRFFWVLILSLIIWARFKHIILAFSLVLCNFELLQGWRLITGEGRFAHSHQGSN